VVAADAFTDDLPADHDAILVANLTVGPFTPVE
jgi:hypothetical protein